MASRRKKSKPKRRHVQQDDEHQPLRKRMPKRNASQSELTRDALEHALQSQEDSWRRLLCINLLHNFDTIITMTTATAGDSWPQAIPTMHQIKSDKGSKNTLLATFLPTLKGLILPSRISREEPSLLWFTLHQLSSDFYTQVESISICKTAAMFGWSLLYVASATAAGLCLIDRERRDALFGLIRNGYKQISFTLKERNGKLRFGVYLKHSLPDKAWAALLKLARMPVVPAPDSTVDALHLFSHLRERTKLSTASTVVQPVGLTSTMYDYQLRGLAWMLERETSLQTQWPVPLFESSSETEHLSEAGHPALFYHSVTKRPLTFAPSFSVSGGIAL